ncbi:MAG TPA: T9SS type A sorting domain-containing protein, partial [Flavobacterium sp.]
VNDTFAAVSGYDPFTSPPPGVFLVTTNKGSSWINRSSGLDVPVNGISFINANTGIAVAVDGMIFKTGNGGINWSSGGLSGTGNSLNSASYLGTDSIIIAGNGGTILGSFSTVVGVKNGNNNLVGSDYHLLQNYPNPFNPATTIKFQVPNSSLVKITVFDILGKEVSTLVNEQMTPGVYNINWDAANYPSGVYYYRLQAGDFSETKKMVLLK